MNSDVLSVPIAELITFSDTEDTQLWVKPGQPRTDIEIRAYDEDWPAQFEALAAAIRMALGDDVLFIQHIGSTSVPGLAAKPIIDIDLVIADPCDEPAYVDRLRDIDYELVIREPNWHEHRAFRHSDPATDEAIAPRSNLHVFGPHCPEVARHRLFRDWLIDHPEDRDLYRSTKKRSAAESNAEGESVMDYNARKQSVIRAIYQRIFASRGWV